MLNTGLSSYTLIKGSRQRGVGLIEILISILLTSFGLLALAGLQAKVTQAQFESHQRTQAIVLLEDMVGRLQSNNSNAANYITSSPLGTGDKSTDCENPDNTAKSDICEWSNLLQGAAETQGSSGASNNKVGAMLGARGCIEKFQDSDAAICKPAIYRVTVAWQGLSKTVAPNVGCGADLYDSENTRRTISSLVVTPLPKC